MIKFRKITSLGLLLCLLSSCDSGVSSSSIGTSTSPIGTTSSPIGSSAGPLLTYVPIYNAVRGDKYSAGIGARLKAPLQDAAVEYLNAGIGSIFSPLSLIDAAAFASILAEDSKGAALAAKLGYQSVSSLEDDVKSYHDYFSFLGGEKEFLYRGRLSNAVIIPKEFDYKDEIKKYGDDIGLASLKSGSEEFLEEEKNFVKEASFDMFTERWSSTSSVTLASSFAYQSVFNFPVYEKKVDFKEGEVDGLEFTSNVAYHEFADYFVLSISFNKEKLVFYVPNGELVTIFSKDVLFESLASLKSIKSTVKIPKFSITSMGEDIGAVSIAAEAKAIGGKYVKILPENLLTTLSSENTTIEQNNTFTLSEKGVSAASATIINTPISPEPTEPIVIDKPFVFSLMDSYNNPLFIGKVNDLS